MHILMLDNQNALKEGAVDTLCRLVTGEADSKRRLYSDEDDFIFEMKRAILLNGINAPADRGNVLDRCLAVELERVGETERRTEEEIWEDFRQEHPRLLGAVFDALSAALRIKPDISLPRKPRMADWAFYAAALYEGQGWGSDLFLRDWDEVVSRQNQATFEGSPVAQTIVAFMEENEEARSPSSITYSRTYPMPAG